jgi:hypothetical protein
MEEMVAEAFSVAGELMVDRVQAVVYGWTLQHLFWNPLFIFQPNMVHLHASLQVPLGVLLELFALQDSVVRWYTIIHTGAFHVLLDFIPKEGMKVAWCAARDM